MAYIKHLGTVRAHTETGDEYRIHLYRTEVIVKSRQGMRTARGTLELETDEGMPVKRIEKGRYEAELGEATIPLCSDDPHAP